MDQNTKRRALLLDLDGTIADTLPHVFDAFRYAIDPWVERRLSNDEIEATFGPPERDCIAKLVPKEHLDEAERRFHEYHETHHGAGVRVAEGISEVVDHARKLGWRLGVFTGKGRRTAMFTLRELGLWDRVEHLVTGDDVVRPKPDPEGLYQAADVLRVPVERILLAGDSPADVAAARGARALVAAVLWAALQPDRMRREGADFTCERASDLLAVIDRLDASD